MSAEARAERHVAEESEEEQLAVSADEHGATDSSPESPDPAAESDEAEEVAPDPAVVALATERDDYLDALRRLQADFENFRKRTSREQLELSRRAGEGLIERFLPVLDAFDLALVHGLGEAGEADEPDQTALAQIASLARDILAREGLERIDEAEVPFDPSRHDAVAHTPREEGEEAAPPLVAEVLRSGYSLKGRVLRPAMVRVRG